MRHSHLSLRGETVDKASSAPGPSAIIATDQVSAELPACLEGYGHPASWTTFLRTNASQSLTRLPVQNIFIQDRCHKQENLNALFTGVHQLLNNDGYFAFNLVTAENCKHKLQENYSSAFLWLYYPLYFLFRRVLPKLNGFRKLCRLLRMPVDVSKAELIGRLMFTGFDLVDLIEMDSETFFIARRNPRTIPSLIKSPPSEGFFFRMQRMGQYGLPISVVKLRSMHPYAEYVQAYIHDTQGLDKGGKFKNDFRVSTGGRILRKYWLDEIPMFYNVLTGDLKLVGVRPISNHYFSLYPSHAQEIRRKHKPGLLPPFYADLPETFEEIVESELKYMKAFDESPFLTDIRYFRKIIINILVNKVRSK
ncbi:sugar transferase [Spirosoma fluviale]|uniref:Sugar transferase n=1 Tax=Spirosoma fluviale TaxID=1597977 RepID=A0A286FEC0_9BACT|nr:sugar transferase [Spirosoma fluviale]SOD81174.1 sugar transferase [Spirosoma fluviale]